MNAGFDPLFIHAVIVFSLHVFKESSMENASQASPISLYISMSAMISASR